MVSHGSSLISLLDVRQRRPWAARHLPRLIFGNKVSSLRIERELGRHTGCVNTVSWSESGDLLCSGSDDTRVCIWNYSDWGLKLCYQTGHSANIFSAKFFPSANERLVSCAGDGQARIFDAAAERLLQVYQVSAHDRAKKIAVELGNPWCFWVCSEDGLVRLFDTRLDSTALTRGSAVAKFVPNAGRGLSSLSIAALRPDYLAVGGDAPEVWVLDRRRADDSGHYGQLASFAASAEGSASGHVTGVCLDEAGCRLAANYCEGHVQVFDVAGAVAGPVPATTLWVPRPMELPPPRAAAAGSGEEAWGCEEAGHTPRRAMQLPPPRSSPESSGEEAWGCEGASEALRWAESSGPLPLPRGDTSLGEDWEVAEAEGEDVGEGEEALSSETSDNDTNLEVAFRAAVDAAPSSSRRLPPRRASRASVALRTPAPISRPAARKRQRLSGEEWRRAAAPPLAPALRCVGHLNVKTVKDVQFLGPGHEFVASGSDDGRLFIWSCPAALPAEGRPHEGELVFAGHADSQVVNCVCSHPRDCVLAASGIDDTVKVLYPAAAGWGDSPRGGELAQVVRRNEDRRRDPAARVSHNDLLFMLQFLGRRAPRAGADVVA